MTDKEFEDFKKAHYENLDRLSKTETWRLSSSNSGGSGGVGLDSIIGFIVILFLIFGFLGA